MRSTTIDAGDGSKRERKAKGRARFCLWVLIKSRHPRRRRRPSSKSLSCQKRRTARATRRNRSDDLDSRSSGGGCAPRKKKRRRRRASFSPAEPALAQLRLRRTSASTTRPDRSEEVHTLKKRESERGAGKKGNQKKVRSERDRRRARKKKLESKSFSLSARLLAPNFLKSQ